MQSNTIIYPLFAVITVVILVFGYKSITTITEKSEEANILQLKTNLRKDIKLSYNYGDINSYSYTVPSLISEVCFYDFSKIGSPVSMGLESRYSIIANSIESGVKKNVFSIDKNKIIIDSDYIDKLSIPNPYYLCKKPKNGILIINVEGKGSSAQIGQFIKSMEFHGTEDRDVVLSLEDVEGLNLVVPGNSGYSGIITFGISTEDNEASISNKIIIETPENTNWNSHPLKLKVPLDMECEENINLFFEPGHIPPKCEGNLAVYEIRDTT